MTPFVDGLRCSGVCACQDVLETALARIGHRRIRVHDLRHTFASHFVMRGGISSRSSEPLGTRRPLSHPTRTPTYLRITWLARQIIFHFRCRGRPPT